jgi:hypothetical protein
MDINRILNGEVTDLSGSEYNGKIKGMVRRINQIDDIGRYRYSVALLANVDKMPPEKLKVLTGGHPVEIIDQEVCYRKLVFPVLSGTYFTAAETTIHVDLSNKNAGSKISYAVQTKFHESEITVLFVPTIEIAKVMFRYRNSILKYNPRSYLEFFGQSVNREIGETIRQNSTNEFALLITVSQ